jgi:hypothetical protein
MKGKKQRVDKGFRREAGMIVLFVIIIVAAFLLIWMRSIGKQYFGCYVTRNADIAQVMEMNQGLELTQEEEEKLLPVQEEWDAFRFSHLSRRVSVTTQSGLKLSGIYYDQGSDETVIVMRQYDTTSEDDFLYGSWYGSQGYNILLTDSRNHGESDGSYSGFGYLEQEDLSAWICYVNETEKNPRIVIHGEGQGAVAALFCEANGNIPDNVVLIVAESVYDSLKNMAVYTLKQTHEVPYIPFGYAIEWNLNHSDAGYTLEDVVLTEEKLKNAKTPVLFLAGEKDTYIPCEYSRNVYEMYPAQKEWIAPKCPHGMIYEEGQEQIERALENLCRND